MIIDGKKVSSNIREEIKKEVALLKKKNINPCLAVVLIGDDMASKTYVEHKKRACVEVGMESREYLMSESTKEEEVLSLIDKLNKDSLVNGILVQLPLPKHIDEKKIIEAIDPAKDVDCFHPYSVGLIFTGQEGFAPCTPSGIMDLIKATGETIEGKECVVVGRSNIVGKPMALLLLEANGTVTVCHSRTKNLKEVCKRADILVVAIGRAKFINEEYVKEGSIVIDVGMNRDENNKLCGDVDFERVKDICKAITPVPGGVGPMTITSLLSNTLIAARKQFNV